MTSDTLGVPEFTEKDWFKYSREKLVKRTRTPYSKCLHFESSGIGEAEAEKAKLRLWKKNCGFCKVKRLRGEESEQEESDSDESQPTSNSNAPEEIKDAPNSSPVQQPSGWMMRAISAVWSRVWNSNANSTHFSIYSDT